MATSARAANLGDIVNISGRAYTHLTTRDACSVFATHAVQGEVPHFSVGIERFHLKYIHCDTDIAAVHTQDRLVQPLLDDLHSAYLKWEQANPDAQIERIPDQDIVMSPNVKSGTTVRGFPRLKPGDFPPPGRDWFSLLFGFSEPNDAAALTKCVRVLTDKKSRKQKLVSLANGRVFDIGKFSTPSLRELRRAHCPATAPNHAKLKFSVVQGDVQTFHGMAQNRLATFQVASQFNCLEFPSPHVTPEAGITDYAWDRTQGPACCVCAGPAVLYRNYFAFPRDDPHPGQSSRTDQCREQDQDDDVTLQLGPQTRDRQIDNLADVTEYVHQFGIAGAASSRAAASGDATRLAAGFLNRPAFTYWTCKNGYTDGVSAHLQRVPWAEIDHEEAKSRLRVGVQEDTEVTAGGSWGRQLLPVVDGEDEAIGRGESNDKDGEGDKQDSEPKKMIVTQVFCSGLAIGYSRSSHSADWEPLARIVLDACYEATLLAALASRNRHNGANGSRRVFLTFIGGGVFGNDAQWIVDAIRKACLKFLHTDVEVYVVSYGPPGRELLQLMEEAKGW